MAHTDPDSLALLLGHDRWATEQVLHLSEGLTDAELDRAFDIGHRTIRLTLGHFVRATNFWNGQMEGEPAPMLPDPIATVELQAFHQVVYAQFERRVAQLVAESRLRDTFVDFSGSQQHYGTTIVHVTQHNHLHRSEILHMLKRLGIEDLPEGDILEWEDVRGES